MQFYQSWAAFSLIALLNLFRRHALAVLGAIVVTQVLEQAWIGLIHERLLKGAIAFPLGLLLWFLVMNGFVLVLILALDDAATPHKQLPLLARAGQRVGRYYAEILKIGALFVLGVLVVVVLGPLLQFTAAAGIAAVALGVPGVVLLTRLSVVPYVVLLEPRPASGPWAVARRALRLTRRRGPAIFTVLLLWVLVVGVLRRFVLPPHQFALDDLVAYGINVVTDYAFAVLLFTVMYTLYRHLLLDDDPATGTSEGTAPGGAEVPDGTAS